MTREEKIEALSEEYTSDEQTHDDNNEMAFKSGILAGIKLRDAELLAMEFDSSLARSEAEGLEHIQCQGATYTFKDGARWQHERFMKILKQK